jgi:hypothetical protein
MSTFIAEEQVAVVPDAILADDMARASAVSWGAIAAGAVATAGLSLFLLQLGVGLGLSSISPWSTGNSTTAISVATGISVCLIAVLASALGGYIVGRLRTASLGPHTEETYFRDSAHGFVAWAFATIISASVIAAAATSVMGSAALGVGANPNQTTAYFSDMLFRSDRAAPPPATPAAQASNDETNRILTRAFTHGGNLSTPDRTYVAERVAARTGLSQGDAEQRVDTVMTQAKATADEARSAAAKIALWMAAALLCGALASAFAAAEGGRERDEI